MSLEQDRKMREQMRPVNFGLFEVKQIPPTTIPPRRRYVDTTEPPRRRIVTPHEPLAGINPPPNPIFPIPITFSNETNKKRPRY